MEQIAERAGVSKATLYDNFEGKAGLTAALLDRYGRRLLTAFAELLGQPVTSEQVVRDGIAIFVAVIDTDPEVYRFIVGNLADDQLVSEIAAPISLLLSTALGGSAPRDGRSEALAHATLGAVITATEWWTRNRDLDRTAFEELLTGYVWAALIGSGLTPSQRPLDLSEAASLIVGLIDDGPGTSGS
jgi:AcrR family transcriptional regulator